jgi:Tol biopolymer transport system component
MIFTGHKITVAINIKSKNAMYKMKKSILIAPVCLAYFMMQTAAAATHTCINYQQDTITHNQPAVTLFAPGAIPTSATGNAAPAFTRDGKTVYIGQSPKGGDISIMVSHLAGGKWPAPEMADFSGKYRDLEPAFSPDGKYIIFASNRPHNVGDSLLDGNYNKSIQKGKGGNLWKVKITKKGAGVPERLPDVINANSSVFSPAVAGDGSIYFMRADSGKSFHIYRSQLTNGRFEKPVRVSFSLDKYGEYDPAVAPDESFIIYSTGRPPAPPHTADLFIVFKEGNSWGDPIDLRSLLSDKVYGVEGRLSPDLKTLYFTNQRKANGETDPDGSYTWMVDISGVLKAHGIK